MSTRKNSMSYHAGGEEDERGRERGHVDRRERARPSHSATPSDLGDGRRKPFGSGTGETTVASMDDRNQ